MEPATFMGLDQASSRGRNFEAPSLTNTPDPLKYLRAIRTWTRRLRVTLERGDTKSEGVYNGLGWMIYDRMDPGFQSRIEGAISSGHLKFEHDNEKVFTPKENTEMLENIFSIVVTE